MPPIHANWNMSVAKVPRPHVTTMGLVYDKPTKSFLSFWRTAKVRSAQLCYSIPSGLHEVGVTLAEQLAIECTEEFNVAINTREAQALGVYENIDIANGYHWVIVVFAVPGDFSTLENREPDKHACVRLITVDEALAIAADPKETWSPGLGSFLLANEKRLRELLS